MKLFLYASIAAFAFALHINVNAQLRTPFKPAPVLSKAIAALEKESIPVSPELFKRALELKADMLMLGAQEFDAIGEQTPYLRRFYTASTMMERLSKYLSEIPAPPRVIQKPGKYLRPWLALTSKQLTLLADAFDALANVVYTSEQKTAHNSLAARLRSVATIIKNALTAQLELEKEPTEDQELIL